MPERILGSMSKKELHGCCDRICSRQRSRVAEQVKGACWLRLRRQAHTRLDGADDAKRALLRKRHVSSVYTHRTAL